MRPLALLKWLLPVFLLVAACFYSLYGQSPLKLAAGDAWNWLLGREAPDSIKALTLSARVPRIVVALLCGAVLACAGLILQTLTKNPLASPALLSLNAGASLGVVLTVALAPALLRSLSLPLAAALGGACSWGLVMLIASEGRRLQQHRLILAGIAVSAFCAALTKTALILAEDQAVGVLSWLAGGVNGIQWADLQHYYLFVLIPIVPLIFLVPKLSLLQLSDDSARSLGLSVENLRRQFNLIVLVWVGASVAICGPIAFVGLLTPHLAKFYIGYDLRRTLPMCALLGALILVSADVLARALAFPGELQAGAVLAIIGAPCFVYLAKRRSKDD